MSDITNFKVFIRFRTACIDRYLHRVSMTPFRFYCVICDNIIDRWFSYWCAARKWDWQLAACMGMIVQCSTSRFRRSPIAHQHGWHSRLANLVLRLPAITAQIIFVRILIPCIQRSNVVVQVIRLGVSGQTPMNVLALPAHFLLASRIPSDIFQPIR